MSNKKSKTIKADATKVAKVTPLGEVSMQRAIEKALGPFTAKARAFHDMVAIKFTESVNCVHAIRGMQGYTIAQTYVARVLHPLCRAYGAKNGDGYNKNAVVQCADGTWKLKVKSDADKASNNSGPYCEGGNYGFWYAGGKSVQSNRAQSAENIVKSDYAAYMVDYCNAIAKSDGKKVVTHEAVIKRVLDYASK